MRMRMELLVVLLVEAAKACKSGELSTKGSSGKIVKTVV